MSKWNKLLDKIGRLENNMRFSEVKKALEKIGYTGTFSKGGSSHCVFRKDGCLPIVIPVHEPIGVVYVTIVRDVLIKEGLL